jgi:hypothetical protein
MPGYSRGRVRVAAPVLALAAVALLGSSSAQAHFYQISPTTWVTANTVDGTPEKAGPCGNEAATIDDGGPSGPTGVVNMLTANADGTTTVSIQIHEVVAHPGWYRVSIAPGRASTQTSTTLPNPDVPTSCTIPITSTPSLPLVADGVLQHTNPFPGPQTTRVTIPAGVTCTADNPCTLQVIEMMTDHQPANNCFYHHCADVAISGSVGGGSSSGAASSVSSSSGASSAVGASTAGTGSSSASSGGSGAATSSASGMSGMSSGGCSIALPGPGPRGLSPGFVGLVGLVGLARLPRRRRRR